MPQVGDIVGTTVNSRGLTKLEGDTKITGTLQTGGDAQNLSETYINVIMDDISTSGPAFVASPVAGTITRIQSVIDGAITGGDAVITTEINGAAVTGGSLTIANSGSAAGDVDVATPTAANTVAIGDAIEIISDNGSTGTVKANFTITILRS